MNVNAVVADSRLVPLKARARKIRASGWLICATLLVSNAAALLQLSNSALFCQGQCRHIFAENLFLSMELSQNHSDAARLYAQSAVSASAGLGAFPQAIAFEALAAQQLRNNQFDEAAAAAQKSADLLSRSSDSVAKSLLVLHEINSRKILAIALWRMKRQTEALASLSAAFKLCRAELSSNNRHTIDLTLAGLASLEAEMLSRAGRLEESGKKKAIASTLLNAPASSQLSAIEKALTAPPDPALWQHFSSQTELYNLLAAGRFAVIDEELKTLEQFRDERGNNLAWSLGEAFLIGELARQGRFASAAERSKKLALRYASIPNMPVAINCWRHCIQYRLCEGNRKAVHSEWNQLIAMMASKPKINWRQTYKDVFNLAQEIKQHEDLKGFELIALLAPYERFLVVQPEPEANANVCRQLDEGLRTMTADPKNLERFDSFRDMFTSEQIVEVYVRFACEYLKKSNYALVERVLELALESQKPNAVGASSVQEEALLGGCARLMVTGKYREANAILVLLNSLNPKKSIFRRVRASACQFVLEGANRGEESFKRVLATATDEREQCLVQQHYLDLLHEYAGCTLANKERDDLLRHLEPRCNQSAAFIARVFGTTSYQYTIAAQQYAAVKEQLGDYGTALKFLEICQENLRKLPHTSDVDQLSTIVKFHKRSCLHH